MKKFDINNIKKVKEVRTNYCPNFVEAEVLEPLKGSPYASRHEVLMINKSKANLLLTILKNNKEVAYGSVIYDTREGDIEAVMWNDETKEKSKDLLHYVKALIEYFKLNNDVEYQKALNRPVVAKDEQVKKEKRAYNKTVESFQRRGYYRRDKYGNLRYVRAATVSF